MLFTMDSDFQKIFNAVKKYAHEGLVDRVIDTSIYDAVFEGHDDNREVNLMRGHNAVCSVFQRFQ